MPILNEQLDWNRIAVDASIREAFQGTPTKTLLSPQKMLCRFITTESAKKKIRGNNTFFSPWWMDWSTTVSMLARWKAVSTTEAVRARMAVTEEFSQELDSLVQIILTKPVYAWKGIAKHQERRCPEDHLHRRRRAVLPAKPCF